MADFGLAAQIGRGGAGGVQQVDPANRMMQMMQVQQAQQNMMLQQELATRQRQLFPLQQQQAKRDLEFTEQRIGLVGKQARGAGIASDTAEIKLRREQETDEVNREVWSFMDRLDRKLVDLNDPDALNNVKNPQARALVQKTLTESRRRIAEADKAGLDRRSVVQASVYQFVSQAGASIKDARTYQTARNKILQVEPGAAEFLPDHYNPDNALLLRDFVASRAATIKDVNGVPVMVRPGSPVGEELAVRRAMPAQPTPAPTQAAPAFGAQGLSVVQPPMPMSPELAQRTVAATPVPTETPGQAPIIQPRASVPAAAPASVPAAAPASVPASQFISERQSVPKPLTIQQERKLRNDIANDYKSVNATIDQMNGVISAAKSVSDLPESTKEAIAGWSGKVPSFRGSSREGDRRWRNLEGKITQLGRQAASLSGAIGSMAVQEWKIVRDMIANTDITNMTVDGLNRQIELIESQARGAMSRVRDAYERQYQEEFGRFGDRFKLPPPSEPSAASANKGSGKDSVDANNKWLR